MVHIILFTISSEHISVLPSCTPLDRQMPVVYRGDVLTTRMVLLLGMNIYSDSSTFFM